MIRQTRPLRRMMKGPSMFQRLRLALSILTLLAAALPARAFETAATTSRQ